jgi:hypothetical protein
MLIDFAGGSLLFFKKRSWRQLPGSVARRKAASPPSPQPPGSVLSAASYWNGQPKLVLHYGRDKQQNQAEKVFKYGSLLQVCAHVVVQDMQQPALNF